MRKDTASRIRALRVKQRLTREQVVSILAIPMEEYVGIEEGRFTPSEDFITDMINLFGHDRNYFVPKPAPIHEFGFLNVNKIGSDTDPQPGN